MLHLWMSALTLLMHRLQHGLPAAGHKGRSYDAFPSSAELGVSLVPASTAQLQRSGVRYLDIKGRMSLARLALAVAPGALDSMPLVGHLWALAELI
ncbi:hypothetical protein CFBP8129_03760 [Xanthomonas hortorum pv. gardneri]|uniref:Uncharacterized protein n=1 Tax=Xanthomonas hortorum pv. gardneri TaxID=2754056 RepID=A0A6V7BKV3_9XANT|nr:hypothetical protein XGA_4413 [Xanthomonas hortorum ATCC 19865]CAD0302368.1 hypothetical protein CFBP2044_03780 [Xanthomonas hortorum pv. cynarae]CAD0302373.1 hypothetical protein CFBP2044_03780 [Xanthomonas hortorum pv. cynarae]CAD0302397.1 hypothetical protein CFBP8129_03760 [Xanthomonas hortorum pv. gardneri]CAD0302402.1 hypothetical protein CFBP8129_03760 [Xanthomonas hortorum pv. gardneri]